MKRPTRVTVVLTDVADPTAAEQVRAATAEVVKILARMLRRIEGSP